MHCVHAQSPFKYKCITTLFANRSTDYGRNFTNETDKFPSDAVAHWYYISKDNVKVVNISTSQCTYSL